MNRKYGDLEKQPPSVIKLLSIALLSASLGCASTPKASDVRITVIARTDCVDGERHPTLAISIENRGSAPLAISETFGMTNRRGFSLSIRDHERQPVRQGLDVDLFTKMRTKCLRKGEATAFAIDLFDWHVIENGERSETSYRYDLRPGDYEVRAHYHAYPHRAWSRCGAPREELVSEWVAFTVLEEASTE